MTLISAKDANAGNKGGAGPSKGGAGPSTNMTLLSAEDGTSSGKDDHAFKTARALNISIYYEALDAMSMITDMSLGPGTSVNLNDEGYREVAESTDPLQMEFFIRRLLSQMGFRVREQGGLQGLIPFYDGEKSVQSFDALKAELTRVAEGKDGWATSEASGASAPLTDLGYKRVAAMSSSRDMSEFVRRVAIDLGLSVSDEGGLEGVSKWHSGEKAVQTFNDLRGELINASKRTNSWIVRGKPCPHTSHPSQHELDEIQDNSTKWAGASEEAHTVGKIDREADDTKRTEAIQPMAKAMHDPIRESKAEDRAPAKTIEADDTKQIQPMADGRNHNPAELRPVKDMKVEGDMLDSVRQRENEDGKRPTPKLQKVDAKGNVTTPLEIGDKKQVSIRKADSGGDKSAAKKA